MAQTKIIQLTSQRLKILFTTPVSASERAWRDTFAQICAATRDRMTDPSHIAQDQLGFSKQTKYKTFYQYVWHLMRAEIESE